MTTMKKEDEGRRFESWHFQLELCDDEDVRTKKYKEEDIERSLNETLIKALILIENNKAHVPAALTSERSPSFPFEIELEDEDEEGKKGEGHCFLPRVSEECSRNF